MRSQVYNRGPIKPAMNMTPLIDVTFLLVVFFLLTNNLGSQQSVPMRLPLLDTPQTKPLDGEAPRLIVNVSAQAEGRVVVRVGLHEFDAGALATDPAHLQALAQVLEGEAHHTIILRAQADLSYRSIQPVLAALRRAGAAGVQVSAYLPGEKPGDNSAQEPQP